MWSANSHLLRGICGSMDISQQADSLQRDTVHCVSFTYFVLLVFEIVHLNCTLDIQVYTEQSKRHAPTFLKNILFYHKNTLKSEKLNVLLNFGNVHYDLA